jgi:hypothetical protein
VARREVVRSRSEDTDRSVDEIDIRRDMEVISSDGQRVGVV